MGAADARASQTTHSRPLQGLTGPASLSGYLSPSSVVAGCTTPVYPTLVPTRSHTPPWYTLPALAVIVMHSHPYSSFRDTVGEPRGVEYTAVSGSQDGYIQLFDVGGFNTAV